MVPDALSASTHPLASVAPQTTPEQAWALAPLLAGGPSLRFGRWIGSRFQYPRPTHRAKITSRLPERPAAVMIHGADGRVATLCLDLDTSKALKEVVDADALRLGKLLQECGLAFIEDFSPSGGRHLYIPLRERLDGSAARELVEALALRSTSLDPSPHQNLSDGCIRVPGSRHKSGGYQTLITPLSVAYDYLRRRNPPLAVLALKAALAPELKRLQAHKARQAKTASAQRKSAGLSLPPNAGGDSPLRRIARTGLYDASRYKSPSEARMAVLNHFAACGWTREQVENELNGQFPGLAALYSSANKQKRLLTFEWTKAQTYVNATRQKTPAPRTREKTAPINNTSRTKLTGGAHTPSRRSIHELVNDLENVVYAVLDHRLQSRGREGISLRLLMRGLLGYMRAKETDVLDVGCRTLAAAMGKHHVTIARLLPVLVKESDGIVTKIADARHKAADIYLVQLPDHFKQLARELTWRKGRVHAVRPVFRALGDSAALVYEGIERGRYSPTTADLVRLTGISRNATTKVLSEMEAMGMVRRTGRQWRTTSVSLSGLAVRLGVLEEHQAQVSRNRRDRAAWHAYLDRFVDRALEEVDMFDPDREDHWIPPDDESIWHAA